jgi:hypothetical protein
MNADIKHGRGHAACTWTLSCSIDIVMQHRHGHVAWTGLAVWTCSMDFEMQNRLGHAERHGHVCSMDI